MKSHPRLFAIDPSLTASGWAVFDIQKNVLRHFGLVTPPGTELPLAKRLDVLQQMVLELLSTLNGSSSDYLVCEGPAPLVKNPQSAIKVEHVRGIFESVARSLGMSVPGRVNPRTVQSEVLGLKGQQLKREEVKRIARTVAEKLFHSVFAESSDQICSSQDVIDACLVGVVASSRVQIALKSGTDVTSLFVTNELRRGGKKVARWSESEVRKLQITSN